MRKQFLFLSIIIIFVLLHGCFQNIQGPTSFTKEWVEGTGGLIEKGTVTGNDPVTGKPKTTTKYVNVHNLNEKGITDTTNADYECKTGDCVCMVCINGSTWFGFRSSLSGGRCYFQKPCTYTTFTELINDRAAPDYAGTDKERCIDGKDFGTCSRNTKVRQFMLGTGTSFADFAGANLYCNNRLGMAVQWLTGTEEEQYITPEKDRATCFLDKDIMPVYVLYSGGTYTKKWPQGIGAGKIANELKDAGPVIITTEMELDRNAADFKTMLGVVKDQITKINDKCENKRVPGAEAKMQRIYCQVALGVKLGDEETVKDMKALLGKNFDTDVDLISFGINSHDAKDCDSQALWSQAVQFAEKMEYTYGKPTIIPYVLFDSGYKIKDKNGKEVCTWSERDMTAGYAGITSAIMQLRDAGTIGIAPYDFGSTQGLASSLANPLDCTDCALKKNEARLSSWYSFCQRWAAAYMDERVRDPDSIMPIRFGSAPAADCEEMAGGQFMLRMLYTSAGAYKDFLAGQPPDLDKTNIKEENMLLSCDACLNENKKWPYDIPQLKAARPYAIAGTDVCTTYPEFEIFGSYFNVDPMILRAVAAHESNMDPCKAATVCPRTMSEEEKKKACSVPSDSGCYAKGYDYVPDPRTDATKCTTAEQQSKGKNADGTPKYRYCGLGMMQSLEPPYTFWPKEYHPESSKSAGGQQVYGRYYSGKDNGAQLFAEADAAKRSTALELAQACAADFNPFNPAHSICVGAYKLSKNYEKGMKLVKDNEAKYALVAAKPKDNYNGNELFGTISNGKEDADKKRIMAMYFALHMYRGVRGMPFDASADGEPIIQKWIDDYYKCWASYKDEANICACAFGSNTPVNMRCKACGQLRDDECKAENFFEYYEKYIMNREGSKINNDYAADILKAYRWMSDPQNPNCKNSNCPSWKRLSGFMCSNEPVAGAPAAFGMDKNNQGFTDNCVRKVGSGS